MNRRNAARATTGGVSTTASAKLNRSAACRVTPASNPAEIVAPERENPRKGRHNPCTTPIRSDWLVRTSPFAMVVGVASVCSLRPRPAMKIRIPTAASALAIRYRLPKMCSISAPGWSLRSTRTITFCNPKPRMPVATVATITCLSVCPKAAEDEK